MTNEEAIELLKNAPIMGVARNDSKLPLAEAVDVAIDALEKQIEAEKTSCEKCKHYKSVKCVLCGKNIIDFFESAESEKNQ